MHVPTVHGPQTLHLQEASFTALQKSDSAGWAIRAEIQATGSVANGMGFLCIADLASLPGL